MAYRVRVILLMCLLAIGCSPKAGTAPQSKTLGVTLGGRQFQLELALDNASRYQGLSDRPAIAPDGGMLFVFPEARELQFVMRRCLAPIDIIFIGAGGRIVAMTSMAVEPPTTPEADLKRYHSGWPAQFAIELAGGTLDRLQLEPGQSVDLPLDDLKRRVR